MSQHCPACSDEIPTSSINITEGVALCPACGTLSRLSEVVEQSRPTKEILANVPKGCSLTELGGEVHIQASLRSGGGAGGLLFFALFWNGIVSIFVVVALAGLYSNLIGPLPNWFPAPTMNGGAPMSLGMTLFLCIFLIPFIVIGVGVMSAFLLCVGGRIDVRLRQEEGEVRTGLGPLGWTRRFHATNVRRVVIGETSWQQNGQTKEVICIEAERTVKFGSMLPQDRREWLRAVLHALLVGPRTPRGISRATVAGGS